MKAVEVPTVAGRDDEIELDLGLSIGGSFRKLPEKPILVQRGGGGREVTSTSGSSLTLVSDGDESAIVVPKGRGEIQAARRREAKRKREEKRLRRGRSFAGGEEEEEEEEEEEGRRPLKKEMRNVDLNLSDDQVDSRDHPKRDPAVQVSYPFSPLQYVPFINGYAIPCVMPYWAAGAAIGHGGELHQPVACRSFRQFPTNQNAASAGGVPELLSNGCQMEQQNGSSSSVISDNYQSSSSREGGGSNNTTKSNSSNSSSDQHQMMSSNPNEPIKPKPCSDNRTQCSEKFGHSHHVSKSSSTTTGIKKEAIVASSKDEVLPSSNPIKSSPPPMAQKVVKTENGKPPKPQTQSRSNIPSLQDMPCVSTTGVGPNGKTVTGFLYTYSNLEVSILCVCHGEFFSPAEFVKHAGGAEVSHPLRHITVLSTNGAPSATR